MDNTLKATSIRLLREQIIERDNRNKLIRDRFGDRITLALTAECEQRDKEIAALSGTIDILEGLD